MRKPDPVELVKVSVPVLIEAVSVMLIIGTAMLWVILLATPVPA